MIYKEYNVSQSVGVVLGSSFSLGGKLYPKGHVITAKDVLLFKKFDLHFIHGAEYQEGDVSYKTAYTQIAAPLCGNGLGYIQEGDDCLIVALTDGILLCEKSRIDKFNSFNSNVIINALAPFSIIKRGAIVAKISILPPLLSQSEIDDIAYRLAGNLSLFSLVDNRNYNAVFIYPHLSANEQERQHFTNITKRLLQGITDLNFTFNSELDCNYNFDNIVAAIYQAINSNTNIIFITRPLPGYGTFDLMSQALQAVTDDVFTTSIPQIDAADLLVAEKNGKRIIVLPFNYHENNNDFVDNLIKQTIFTERLNTTIFASQSTPPLAAVPTVDNIDKAIAPFHGNSDKAKVGAVILAAGQGRRAGSNKMLAVDQSGLPMFMHAVHAAIASQAKPVFVITGYRHEEMEAWLQKLDVNVLYNPAYANGVKTSIQLGLKAMPASCYGAVLLPGDMPNITAMDINKMIAKIDDKQEKQVVLFAHKGVKNNPVLWSKSLYNKADLVPENSSLRVVLAEHSDYVTVIETKDKNKLWDINFPNDVREYENKISS